MYSNYIEIIICEDIKINYLNDFTYKQILIPYWSTVVSTVQFNFLQEFTITPLLQVTIFL